LGHSLAWASVFPEISLGISRQTVASPAGRQKFWRTGIAFEIPIWAFGRQRGEILEARAALGQATAEYEAIRMAIQQEAKAAFLSLETAEQQVMLIQKRILPTAEAVYEVAQKSYDEGKASFLDLLNAQRDLIETRMEEIEALFAYRSAWAQLLRAVGRDLKAEEN